MLFTFRPEVVFMLMSWEGWAYFAGSALHSAHGLRSFSFAPLSQFYYDLQTGLGEYFRCGSEARATRPRRRRVKV